MLSPISIFLAPVHGFLRVLAKNLCTAVYLFKYFDVVCIIQGALYSRAPCISFMHVNLISVNFIAMEI